jgi:hypothetical protein
VTATASSFDHHVRLLFTEVDQHADERGRLLRLREQPTLAGARRCCIVAACVGDPPIEPGHEVTTEKPVSRKAAGLIHGARVRSM